jgi:GNAT superfamily N-acetyltransferase
MSQVLELRRITAADAAVLYRIYASTREAELEQVDWSAEQKAAFLHMQFQAQHNYYAEHYPNGQFQLILLAGTPAGRLYLDCRDNEIRIVDISLLPPYRNHGIGTGLLEEILAEGERAHVPVTIHVECFNPALRLYQRLGFRLAEDKGVYYFLEKSPTQISGRP